jgi:predicted DNA-binding transcriptional regulator AlpA
VSDRTILVSYAEIAEFVGVSRQRIHQLGPVLPEPDVTTGSGETAWRASTIRRWDEKRNRRAGRPRSS